MRQGPCKRHSQARAWSACYGEKRRLEREDQGLRSLPTCCIARRRHSLGKESQRPCQSDRLNEYSLGTKVILWASLWISIGGVGNANLIATTNTEAKPMKNSITTCVESKRAVKASAHKSMHGPIPRHSGVKTLCVLGKIDTKKSVRCGAALLRARLGSSPNREIASGNLAGSSSRVNAGGSNPPTRTHLVSFKN